MKHFYTLLLGLLLGASAIGQEIITMTTALPVGTQIYIGIDTDNTGPLIEIKYDLGDGIISTGYLDVNGGYGIREATRGSKPIKIYTTEVISLDCYNIKLTSLDVTQCTALKYLRCYQNQLTELNVSNNPNLFELDCSINKIQALDLTNKAELTKLSCGGNRLTALNVTQNTKLTSLELVGNNISSLDISKNNALTRLECGGNKFTYATLPIPQPQWQYYNYINQDPLLIAKSLITGAEVDLSSQFQINGATTGYNWKKYPGGVLLKEGTDYTISGGKTIFLKASDSVYCELINNTFPLFQGINAFKTTNILITPTPKKAQTITFPALPSKKVGDAPFTLSATASSSLPITYSSSNSEIASITGNNTVNILKAGTVTITAAQGGDSNWEAASASHQLTITAAASIKKAQTISFDPIPAKKLGDDAFDLKATATSNLDVSFSSNNTDIISITGTKVTILKAGTVTITAEQGGNGEWNTAESVSQTLIIGKKDQTINFDPIQPKKLGDAAFDLKATASSSLNVTFASNNSAIASVSGTKVTILKAGTVTITASQAGNADWNAAQPVALTLTIGKKVQTISFDPIQSKKVGDAQFDLKAKASSNLAVTFSIDNTDVASLTGAKVTIRKAGTITITATQAGNADWEPASTSQKLTISSTTGINEEEDNLSIYPNPVTETLYIKSKGLENPNISIFNILGTNVWSGRVTGQSINVSQLPAGIYLLRIGNKNVVKTIRFEKQ